MSNSVCENCNDDLSGLKSYDTHYGGLCEHCYEKNYCTECQQVVLDESFEEIPSKGLVCRTCIGDSEGFWTGEEPSWMKENPEFMDSYDPDKD